jgi:hypothetical protein
VKSIIELKNRGLDSSIVSKETKWSGLKTRCVKTHFADGTVRFHVAGPHGEQAIEEVEFDSSSCTSRELVTLNLSGSSTEEQLSQTLNAVDKYISEYHDETTRGECFEREYFCSYMISRGENNFRVDVEIYCLAWSSWDTYEDHALIGSEQGAYLPDGLSDYAFSYYLEISEDGEMLDFDCNGAEEKCWIFLDDPRIHSSTIEELWEYAGFAEREEDERRQKALSAFLANKELSERHRSIRERLSPIVGR